MPRSRHRSRNSTAGEHAHEMCTIFSAAVNVAAHAFLADGHAVERLRAEAFLERLFERRHTEDSISARSGDGDAHFRTALGDKHADKRIARSRIWKFYVARFVGLRKLHL